MVRKGTKAKVDDALDRYGEKMKEVAEMFKPIPITEYKQPEPAKFTINDTLEIGSFVHAIMEVLEGHTIQEIFVASQIVQQYVLAQQGQGGMFISPRGGFGV